MLIVWVQRSKRPVPTPLQVAMWTSSCLFSGPRFALASCAARCPYTTLLSFSLPPSSPPSLRSLPPSLPSLPSLSPSLPSLSPSLPHSLPLFLSHFFLIDSIILLENVRFHLEEEGKGKNSEGKKVHAMRHDVKCL